MNNLNNPILRPSEIKKDFASAFSSPEPTKRFHGESEQHPQYELTGLKVMNTPKINLNMPAEQFIVEIGKRISNYDTLIDFHMQNNTYERLYI